MTRITITICLSTLLLLQFSMISYAQDRDPEVLLEHYLETGDIRSMETIKEQFPESVYYEFCDIYELLHVNNQKAKELAESLIRENPDFAPGYFALGTIYGNGLGQYSTALIQFNKSIDLIPVECSSPCCNSYAICIFRRCKTNLQYFS